MKYKQILFSGILTATIGIIVGITIEEMTNNKYNNKLYQDIYERLALVGGVVGSILGATQESIAQLKRQRDLEKENSEFNLN